MKEKDLLTILGYIILILGLGLSQYGSPKTGLFFMSMAAGFFGRSIYLRFIKKEK